MSQDHTKRELSQWCELRDSLLLEIREPDFNSWSSAQRRQILADYNECVYWIKELRA